MPLFVFIRVTGPKCLIPTPYVWPLQCDLSWTWFEFFRNKCNLRISPDDKIVVRKASYPKSGISEAKLGDNVRDFINTYGRVRATYSVRLVMKLRKRKQRPVIRPDAAAVRRTGTDVYRVAESSASAATNDETRVTRSVQHATKEVFTDFKIPAPPKKIEANLPEYQPQLVLEPLEATGFPIGIDDDARSTTTVVEDEELGMEGIENCRIKQDVNFQLNRFSNAELLRIKEELQRLANYQYWHRLTYRVPRSSYLLSSIFGIQTDPNRPQF
ncbi:unnamed protein product [Orchesella dallaii]|uniref:Uncharacterized protein n=1 Tax=Orchesella dallaii TaxID=48710 RepID=A0ABP1R4Y5_9HEXA